MPAGETEDRAKTRERFNEVFRKYAESERKKAKKKKKSAETQEAIVLQNLKKNLNLEKDTEDDETILQNTYQPEQGSPRYAKNKQRERETMEKVNLNNSRNQEDSQTSKAKRKSKRELPSLSISDDVSKAEIAVEPDRKESKRKSKNGKSKGVPEAKAERQAEDGEDELLQEYQLQMEQEEEKTVTKANAEEESVASPKIKLNNDVGKKKKKKLKSVITQSEEGRNEDADQEAVAKNESEGKKKKTKKKHVAKETSESEAEEPQKPKFDDSLVLGVFVHRADRLKNDMLISHPMVKIHVVDEVTGQYVKKEDCHRPVASFYERENVDHILPIMTQPFDFRKNKSVIPEWQEQIIFNERFGYLVEQSDDGPRVLLFFEILDFMTMEEARANVDVDEHERGFRKIAWAFLKLVGTNGALNVDSRLRLQLFCPPPRAKRQSKAIEVVEWWRKHPRNKHSSTLYVTVKGVKLPERVDPSTRSMMALQEERGSASYSDLQNEATRKSLMQPPDSTPPVLRWSRLPGQVCRIPNKPMLSFRGGQMGCFTLLFSHAGTMLAAACADRDAFPVVVYEIPSGKALAAFSGHLKIVYDLCWSGDDGSLLSASSDGTVREWNVQALQVTAQKVLPHPSFVYCAQYHPTAQSVVASGGYDSVVRVWRLDVDDVNGQLLQELEGHSSFINTLCFDPEGSRMFSADNAGQIVVWRTLVNEGGQPRGSWRPEKRIEESDLKGVPVNMLQLHPNGRSLLIHAKDSILRMMDLRILAVKKYTGATNHRERIYSTFTPCGNFIFSGSEDGMAYVWSTDTGDQVAVYSELCYPTALHGVSFHPHDNMVAFCAFGQGQPVHVYLYDRKASQPEARSTKSTSALSGSASADRTLRNTPDPPALQDTPTASALDQFAQATRLALKMQHVKEQLDSVLEPHQRPSSSAHACDHERTPSSESAAMGLNALLPLPSLRLSGSVVEQLIPPGAPQRGFSPVAQRLKAASPFRLQQDLPGSLSSGLHSETDPPPPSVVALHDYRASRSDELTIRRGDAVQVLYKDTDRWWFGRLASGQQGYFLASCVADQKELDKEAPRPAEALMASSDGTAGRSTPTRVSAAIASSGELRFLSEPTLSDTEPEVTEARARRKKKVKKPGVPAASLRATDADASQSSSFRRRNRPLPQRARGRSNDAFETDA